MKVSPHGFSLVIVLVALAMMSLLALALLSGASHSLRYAQGDANLAREVMLADSGAALVIGQIQ
jgi:type II secretory pathway pseudopilin PulG